MADGEIEFCCARCHVTLLLNQSWFAVVNGAIRYVCLDCFDSLLAISISKGSKT